MLRENTPQGFPTRAPYKNLPQECPAECPVRQERAPRKSSLRVSHKSPASMPHKSVLQVFQSFLQECPTRMSREGLLQECRVRVPHKSVLQERILQECPARVSHKSFAQECLLQECLPRECPTKSVPQHQGLPYAGPSADTGQPEQVEWKDSSLGD